MKRIELRQVYEWGVLTVLFLVVLHAPISVGFGSLFPDFAAPIKAWKEVVLSVLAVMAITLLTQKRLWRSILSDRLIQLCAAYLGVHLVTAAVLGGDPRSVASGLLIDLRYIGMFVLTYCMVRIRPDAVTSILKTVAAGAGVVVGFGLLQVTVLPDDVLGGIGYSKTTITPFTTIDSNPDFVRINSTLRGPNPLGALCVVYAALMLAYLIKRRDEITNRRRALGAGMLGGSMAVLAASYSRSALIALVVVLTLVPLAAGRVSRKLVLIAAASLVVLSGALALVSSTDWYSNVILHEDPESMVVSKSNDGHVESFLFGAQRMLVQPFGAGVGSTGSASLYDDEPSNDIVIENSYFFIAHESGWLGLLIFLAIFGTILYRLWQMRSSWVALGVFAGGVGLAIIGILLPVWVDDTVSLIWWGLAGMAVAMPSGIIDARHAKRTRKQTSTRAS